MDDIKSDFALSCNALLYRAVQHATFQTRQRNISSKRATGRRRAPDVLAECEQRLVRGEVGHKPPERGRTDAVAPMLDALHECIALRVQQGEVLAHPAARAQVDIIDQRQPAGALLLRGSEHHVADVLENRRHAERLLEELPLPRLTLAGEPVVDVAVHAGSEPVGVDGQGLLRVAGMRLQRIHWTCASAHKTRYDKQHPARTGQTQFPPTWSCSLCPVACTCTPPECPN